MAQLFVTGNVVHGRRGGRPCAKFVLARPFDGLVGNLFESRDAALSAIRHWAVQAEAHPFEQLIASGLMRHGRFCSVVQESGEAGIPAAH